MNFKKVIKLKRMWACSPKDYLNASHFKIAAAVPVSSTGAPSQDACRGTGLAQAKLVPLTQLNCVAIRQASPVLSQALPCLRKLWHGATTYTNVSRKPCLRDTSAGILATPWKKLPHKFNVRSNSEEKQNGISSEYAKGGSFAQLQNNKKFYNQCFDKGRLKIFVLWFLLNYGEHKTVKLVEQLKNVGFDYASKAGISLGIDDLKIPPKKTGLIFDAEKQTKSTVNQYIRGEITGVERFQRLMDIWHRTSEVIKQEVIEYFEATDLLNPVYMMAFSGARGNISQVRQLVGMRGLMADPQGQIIDFPIRSNFREGLTLTEYIISSYGARKGIVDTALRTANAGYLTRRLVDVAQHVIISNFDCGTRRGIFLIDMKEGNKTIHSLTHRAVGRILARDLYLPSRAALDTFSNKGHSELSYAKKLAQPEQTPVLLSTQLNSEAILKASPLLASRNEEITLDLALTLEGKPFKVPPSEGAAKLSNLASTFTISKSGNGESRGTLQMPNKGNASESGKIEKIFVRSPLTCETSKLICQLCYGWSLAQGNLVSIGEAVGVVAAQSIGEPGTQLTMRTFHTGGVFSGDISDQIRAPFDGLVEYVSAIPGTLIRTLEGKMAFLTKGEGSFFVRKSLTGDSPSNVEGAFAGSFSTSKKYKIPFYTLLYIRNGQKVYEKEVIAQISSISKKKNATDDAELTIKSEYEGQFYSKSLGFREKQVGFGVLQPLSPEGFCNPEYSEEKPAILSVSSGVKLRSLTGTCGEDIPRSGISSRAGSYEEANKKLKLKELSIQNYKKYEENKGIDNFFEAWTWGYAWVLSGKYYELKYASIFFPILGDSLNFKSSINQTKWRFNLNTGSGELYFSNSINLFNNNKYHNAHHPCLNNTFKAPRLSNKAMPYLKVFYFGAQNLKSGTSLRSKKQCVRDLARFQKKQLEKGEIINNKKNRFNFNSNFININYSFSKKHFIYTNKKENFLLKIKRSALPSILISDVTRKSRGNSRGNIKLFKRVMYSSSFVSKLKRLSAKKNLHQYKNMFLSKKQDLKLINSYSENRVTALKATFNPFVAQPILFLDLNKIIYKKYGYILQLSEKKQFYTIEKSFLREQEILTVPHLVHNLATPELSEQNIKKTDLLFYLKSLKSNQNNNLFPYFLHWFPAFFQTSTGGYVFFETFKYDGSSYQRRVKCSYPSRALPPAKRNARWVASADKSLSTFQKGTALLESRESSAQKKNAISLVKNNGSLSPRKKSFASQLALLPHLPLVSHFCAIQQSTMQMACRVKKSNLKLLSTSAALKKNLIKKSVVSLLSKYNLLNKEKNLSIFSIIPQKNVFGTGLPDNLKKRADHPKNPQQIIPFKKYSLFGMRWKNSYEIWANQRDASIAKSSSRQSKERYKRSVERSKGQGWRALTQLKSFAFLSKMNSGHRPLTPKPCLGETCAIQSLLPVKKKRDNFLNYTNLFNTYSSRIFFMPNQYYKMNIYNNEITVSDIFLTYALKQSMSAGKLKFPLYEQKSNLNLPKERSASGLHSVVTAKNKLKASSIARLFKITFSTASLFNLELQSNSSTIVSTHKLLQFLKCPFFVLTNRQGYYKPFFTIPTQKISLLKINVSKTSGKNLFSHSLINKINKLIYSYGKPQKFTDNSRTFHNPEDTPFGVITEYVTMRKTCNQQGWRAGELGDWKLSHYTGQASNLSKKKKRVPALHVKEKTKILTSFCKKKFLPFSSAQYLHCADLKSSETIADALRPQATYNQPLVPRPPFALSSKRGSRGRDMTLFGLAGLKPGLADLTPQCGVRSASDMSKSIFEEKKMGLKVNRQKKALISNYLINEYKQMSVIKNQNQFSLVMADGFNYKQSIDYLFPSILLKFKKHVLINKEKFISKSTFFSYYSQNKKKVGDALHTSSLDPLAALHSKAVRASTLLDQANGGSRNQGLDVSGPRLESLGANSQESMDVAQNTLSLSLNVKKGWVYVTTMRDTTLHITSPAGSSLPVVSSNHKPFTSKPCLLDQANGGGGASEGEAFASKTCKVGPYLQSTVEGRCLAGRWPLVAGKKNKVNLHKQFVYPGCTFFTDSRGYWLDGMASLCRQGAGKAPCSQATQFIYDSKNHLAVNNAQWDKQRFLKQCRTAVCFDVPVYLEYVILPAHYHSGEKVTTNIKNKPLTQLNCACLAQTGFGRKRPVEAIQNKQLQYVKSTKSRYKFSNLDNFSNDQHVCGELISPAKKDDIVLLIQPVEEYNQFDVNTQLKRTIYELTSTTFNNLKSSAWFSRFTAGRPINGAALSMLGSKSCLASARDSVLSKMNCACLAQTEYGRKRPVEAIQSPCQQLMSQQLIKRDCKREFFNESKVQLIKKNLSKINKNFVFCRKYLGQKHKSFWNSEAVLLRPVKLLNRVGQLSRSKKSICKTATRNFFKEDGIASQFISDSKGSIDRKVKLFIYDSTQDPKNQKLLINKSFDSLLKRKQYNTIQFNKQKKTTQPLAKFPSSDISILKNNLFNFFISLRLFRGAVSPLNLKGQKSNVKTNKNYLFRGREQYESRKKFLVCRKPLNLSSFIISYTKSFGQQFSFKYTKTSLSYQPVSNFEAVLDPLLSSKMSTLLSSYLIFPNNSLLSPLLFGGALHPRKEAITEQAKKIKVVADWRMPEHTDVCSSIRQCAPAALVPPFYASRRFYNYIPRLFESPCFSFHLISNLNTDFFNTRYGKQKRITSSTTFMYSFNNKMNSNETIAKTNYYSPFNGEVVYTCGENNVQRAFFKKGVKKEVASDTLLASEGRDHATAGSACASKKMHRLTPTAEENLNDKHNELRHRADVTKINQKKEKLSKKIRIKSGNLAMPNSQVNNKSMIITKTDLVSYYFLTGFTEYKEILLINKKNKYVINDILVNFLNMTDINLTNLKPFFLQKVKSDQQPATSRIPSIELESLEAGGLGDWNKDVNNTCNEQNTQQNVISHLKETGAGGAEGADASLDTNFFEQLRCSNLQVSNLVAGIPQRPYSNLVGDFLVYGDQISKTTAVKIAGQIIHYNQNKITLRRSQPILISPKGILHKFDGDFIDPKTPVITLSYQKLKTGDIIQGIPKVEQFFEARTTKRGSRFFRDSLPSLLKGLFKRYQSKLPLDLAVRQSFYKIQQIIVDGVQRVYKSQGVTIADKHLEVIVKQMTSKVRIIDGAQTGFFPGEVVDLDFVERINSFLIKKITYEPLVLGITKASLEVDSFLSAASFQQTTRILSKAAISRKKDFLKGLKENVILGNLIPAGTGFLVYLDDFKK